MVAFWAGPSSRFLECWPWMHREGSVVHLTLEHLFHKIY